MALPPQKMREVVFQLLYSTEEGSCDPIAALTLLFEELTLSKGQLPLILERVQAIRTALIAIDALIVEYTPSYAFERIHSVERNIMRLATYEILYDPFIPPKVAISEALRLTRKFSIEASAAFVNAVLDAIYHSSLSPTGTIQPIDSGEECAS